MGYFMKKLLFIYFVFVGFVNEVSAINFHVAIQDLYDLERATKICRPQQELDQEAEQSARFIKGVEKIILANDAPDSLCLLEGQKEYESIIERLKTYHKELGEDKE